MKLPFRKASPVPTFRAFRKVPEPRARLYDHYSGIAVLPESPWGTAGCELQPGAVLLQTYKTDVFRLAYRLGDAWIEQPEGVRPDDPGVLELRARGRIIEFGASPREIEKRERIEAERAREIARANPPGPRRLRVAR